MYNIILAYISVISAQRLEECSLQVKNELLASLKFATNLLMTPCSWLVLMNTWLKISQHMQLEKLSDGYCRTFFWSLYSFMLIKTLLVLAAVVNKFNLQCSQLSFWRALFEIYPAIYTALFSSKSSRLAVVFSSNSKTEADSSMISTWSSSSVFGMICVGWRMTSSSGSQLAFPHISKKISANNTYVLCRKPSAVGWSLLPPFCLT